MGLTLLHSEWPKLNGVLSAIGLKAINSVELDQNAVFCSI